MCDDPTVRALEDLGYSLIRLPRDGIDVFDVGIPQRSGAELVGTLGGFVSSPAPFPTVERGLEGADISGKKTNACSLDFGLKLLEELLGAFGVSVPSLKAAFTSTKAVKFVFEDVRIDRMDADSARRYADDPEAYGYPGPIADRMDRAKDGFMLVEVLRSNKFSVEAVSSRSGSAQIELKLLKDLIGADVGVKVSRESETTVSFEGATRLAFGFKEWSLFFRSRRRDGVTVLAPELRPTEHRLGPLSLGDAPGSPDARRRPSGLMTLRDRRAEWDTGPAPGATASDAVERALLSASGAAPAGFSEADFDSDDPDVVSRLKAASAMSAEPDGGALGAMGDRISAVAEGDSWFKFPLVTDLIDQLRLRHGMRITNCAEPGDTLLDMAYGVRYGSSRRGVGPQLREVLATIDRRAPDVVLLSAGGNDVVPDLADFLNHNTSGDLLNRPYLDYFLRARIEQVYDFMLTKIREHTDAPVVMHSYAYVHPTGRGAGILGFRFAGPWFLPVFRERGIDPDRGKRLVLDPLINAFHGALTRVAGAHRDVCVCDLRHVVPNTPEYWRDEIHLRSRGARIASDAVRVCVDSALGRPGPCRTNGSGHDGAPLGPRDPRDPQGSHYL